MSADHLTTSPVHELAAGVLAVLAGNDVYTTAATKGLDPDELDEAIRVYQAAGFAALERRAEHDWYQVRVQFPDWQHAETIAATSLGPRLDQLQTNGALAGWWYLRKHPCWRLRLRGADTKAVNHVLTDLTNDGLIARWWPTVYEPETTAFGGPPGTDIAHELFCADTRGVLNYARLDTPGLDRRELSILLLSGLLHAAELDNFETGDVFARITQIRPIPPEADTKRLQPLAQDLRVLLSIPDPRHTELFAPGGPAAHATPWLAAFQTAGHQLNDAATLGLLDRGIRAILTHIIIFHWNRFNLSAITQGILAQAASTALLPPT